MPTTLINDPFSDDAAEMLGWLYCNDARARFWEFHQMGQRAGQAFMNVLYEFDAESYNRLLGSICDPFNQDKHLPAALDRMTSK